MIKLSLGVRTVGTESESTRFFHMGYVITELSISEPTAHTRRLICLYPKAQSLIPEGSIFTYQSAKAQLNKTSTPSSGDLSNGSNEHRHLDASPYLPEACKSKIILPTIPYHTIPPPPQPPPPPPPPQQQQQQQPPLTPITRKIDFLRRPLAVS